MNGLGLRVTTICGVAIALPLFLALAMIDGMSWAHGLILLLVQVILMWLALQWGLGQWLLSPLRQLAASSKLTSAPSDPLQLVQALQAQQISSFEQIAEQVQNLSETVEFNAESMAAASDNTLTVNGQQQRELSALSETLEQLNSNAAAVATNATDAASQTTSTRKFADDGAAIVISSMDTVNQLTEQIDTTANKVETLRDNSDNISSVLTVIRSIAEQTNLLALNAAIEAARAGEQGRGFAVVADEVRSLAQKTQHSTEEIETIINELQKASTEANAAMQESQQAAQQTIETSAKVSDALEHIRANVTAISDMNNQIAEHANTQQQVAQTASNHVSSLQALSDSVSGNIQVASDNGQQLAGETNSLRRIVEQLQQANR
ncbi:hypothetical protein GCM10011369_30480 [Neiella marina]|uniref:Methyl-accepting transducer domain-containing protein n=1 Tax=Neiella marina TaxID=508461 RepID=A0A8J2XQW1_9GAMM|nr:methyl-accepting chemotaxis protein [Neiella marina]GGA86338.1 hypothetical protein GCM10011369_30480 [Neiella marina]